MYRVNLGQRAIVAISAIILLIMLLYPPHVGYSPRGFKYSAGYSFITSLNSGSYGSRIDAPVLMTQYLFVVTICGLFFIALASPKMKNDPGKEDLKSQLSDEALGRLKDVLSKLQKGMDIMKKREEENRKKPLN